MQNTRKDNIEILRPRVARVSLIALLLALAACGGSSSTQNTPVEVLPDGPNDPHAYTELFLSHHPGATLRPGLMAILTLEPTRGSEDTGTQDGVDVVSYQFDAAVQLLLALDPSADRVGALVVRDARGREEARVTSGNASVRLGPGRHALEVHHVNAGDPTAPSQVVFVQPLTGGSPALVASANCTACNFDNSSLENQKFDGLDLSGSMFNLTIIDSCSFLGTNLTSTTFVASVLRGSQFNGATMGRACFFSYTGLPTGIFSCDFRGADLTDADFNNCNIQFTTFGDSDPSMAANLSSTTWSPQFPADEPCSYTNLVLVDFRNVDLTGAQFLGTNMSGVDFSGATLTGANLTGAQATCDVNNRLLVTTCDDTCTFGLEPTSGRRTDLSNAILVAAGLPTVQFQGMKLSAVDLQGAQLGGGDFDGFDVSNSDFSGADLAGTQLNGANLQGATLKGATLSDVQLNGANLDGVELQGLTMDGAQLNGVSFYERNLQQINLSQAQLVGTNLDFSNLSGAKLSGATFGVPTGSTMQPASLQGAYMPNVDLSYADLRNVSLSYAHLYGDSRLSNFTGALLDNAKLDHTICSGSQFTMASLASASFSQAQLVNCSFAEADLTDASFDTAYLEGADFSGAARLEGANLFNAAVSTMAGSWTYNEHGMPVTYEYGPTDLGGIASLADVTCPNGEDGPCTGTKLTPRKNGPFPPQPTCVPTPPCYDNCPVPTPTPTPPPLAVPNPGRSTLS